MTQTNEEIGEAMLHNNAFEIEQWNKNLKDQFIAGEELLNLLNIRFHQSFLREFRNQENQDYVWVSVELKKYFINRLEEDLPGPENKTKRTKLEKLSEVDAIGDDVNMPLSYAHHPGQDEIFDMISYKYFDKLIYDDHKANRLVRI